jgi:hypothetical protein
VGQDGGEGKEPSSPTKFAWGLVFVGWLRDPDSAGAGERQLASPMWLTARISCTPSASSC